MDLSNPPQPQQMNLSYFKPEFSGKAEEDAMVHLLKTNDWMDTYNFPDDTKVRRFCLTLMGEARLWYESLKPLDMDWKHCRHALGSNIQNLAVQENSISTCGHPFTMMKMKTL